MSKIIIEEIGTWDPKNCLICHSAATTRKAIKASEDQSGRLNSIAICNRKECLTMAKARLYILENRERTRQKPLNYEQVSKELNSLAREKQLSLADRLIFLHKKRMTKGR